MSAARVMRPALAAILLLACPATAQDHSDHMSHAEAAPRAASEQTVPPAAGSDAGHPGPQSSPPADPHAGHDMPAAGGEPDAVGPNTMGPGQSMAASPGPEMETPPPAEAGSGPPRAADAIWGADAMRASRRDLQQTHGDYPLFWLLVDRAEVQIRDGANGYLWDLQGYYGGPTSRFWFKSEGEGDFSEAIDDAEIQALYSRAIAPFFDLQVGVRQDVAEHPTTYAVLGVEGLAPYMFEVDAALFFSHRGDLTARAEVELDQRITQRLILQPRAEINLSAQDVPELGVGAGLDNIEVGLRLRYEIVREFAPYIGIEQAWRVGQSADFARADGVDPASTSFVVGVRFWF